MLFLLPVLAAPLGLTSTLWVVVLPPPTADNLCSSESNVCK